MYKLGFQNNNCIGCPKGGRGYWNMIRKHFPDTFERMAKLQRELGNGSGFWPAKDGSRITLDKLDPSIGVQYDEPSIECSVICDTTELEETTAMNWNFDKSQPPMPWDAPKPALPDVAGLAETVKLIQADMRAMVTHTAVIVHATGPQAAELGMLVNMPRGQLMPAGECRYSGGNVLRFQDLGMPQPGCPFMANIEELVNAVYYRTTQLGLGVEP